MKKMIFTLLCLFPLLTFGTEIKPEQQIQMRLKEFITYWNQGDLNEVISLYENSSKTVLVSATTVVKGYDHIADFLKTHYSTNEAMGKINFSEIEIKLLSNQHVMAMGKISETLASGKNKKGDFTFIYEKTPTGWKIVVDRISYLNS